MRGVEQRVRDQAEPGILQVGEGARAGIVARRELDRLARAAGIQHRLKPAHIPLLWFAQHDAGRLAAAADPGADEQAAAEHQRLQVRFSLGEVGVVQIPLQRRMKALQPGRTKLGRHRSAAIT